MRKDWNGLLKILEIEHLDKNGDVLWSDKNLYNTFHQSGEQYILRAAFTGGNTSNAYIPSSFYFGLDDRATIAVTDTMDTITNLGNEPTTNGYSRVAVSSTGVFEVSFNGSHYLATGPIISFSAVGGAWGPVSKLFLTTLNNNSGSLISSVLLNQTLTLTAGQSINMRMALALQDTPA